MNKRIKDLADQAKLQPYYDAQEGYIERFAELIIKECADIADEAYHRYAAPAGPIIRARFELGVK